MHMRKRFKNHGFLNDFVNTTAAFKIKMNKMNVIIPVLPPGFC